MFFFSGLTEVKVKNGNISIGSTSGSLSAVTKSGNIDVSLSKHDDVTLKTNTGRLSKNFVELIFVKLFFISTFGLQNFIRNSLSDDVRSATTVNIHKHFFLDIMKVFLVFLGVNYHFTI